MAERICLKNANLNVNTSVIIKLLIKLEELDNFKSRDKIPLECEYCKQTFYRRKNDVQCAIKGKSHCVANFCSKKCHTLSNINKIKLNCKQCNKQIQKRPSEINNNNFCSLQCAGTYNMQHRTTGTRRSKLEFWLENQLNLIYPSLQIKYNDTSAIKAELDIYIPSLKLAFELNGIFHYEPIYGIEKLSNTQQRDKRKVINCYEQKIELCIIDTTKHRYFKEKTSKVYLDIICNIINQRLAENTAPAADTPLKAYDGFSKSS